MTPPRIDLVSDTSTRPTAAMHAAMAAAEIGDEQMREDPTTTRLEERVAGLLGQQAAVFLPTGTMCNQIAFLVHCRAGDEIIAAANAHVVGSEGAGAAALAGAFMRGIETPTGIFDADVLADAIRPARAKSPRSRVVVVEQTSNRGGGLVWPRETVDAVADMASRHGLALHVDGARLFNAAIAAGLPPDAFSARADSVWVDFSKGLGCPMGAALAGSRRFIEAAWLWKFRLGGALRQSGVIAAACLHALDHHVQALAEDHAKARRLAELAGRTLTIAQPRVETNILFLDTGNAGMTAAAVADLALAQGVRVGVEGETRLRCVTHRDVTMAGVEEAGTILAEIAARH